MGVGEGGTRLGGKKGLFYLDREGEIGSIILHKLAKSPCIGLIQICFPHFLQKEWLSR